MARNKQNYDLALRSHFVAPLPSPGVRAWPAWPLRAILAVLFLGPLVAPLFQATQLPLVADSGALARDLLSRYICPTPAKSYVLLGFPMAVCARCWGATIGLWAAWFVFRRPAKAERATTKEHTVAAPVTLAFGLWSLVSNAIRGYLNLAWPLRLTIGALPFLLWVLEIDAWTAAPLWVLLLNGAFAGFWAGLFFYSIWPGLRRN